MKCSKVHWATVAVALLGIVTGLLIQTLVPPKLTSYAQVLPNGKIVIDKDLIEGVERQYPSLLRHLLWLIGTGSFTQWAMPLTEESIVSAARARSGLGPDAAFWYDAEAGEKVEGPANEANSYMKTYWYSRLQVLLKATREEAAPYLSAFGWFITRDTIVESLANQMRAVDLIRKHPDILKEKIDRPIVITGPPRTMTTHGQSILAQHPDVLYLRFTESRDPLQPENLDPKLVYTDADPRAKLLKIGRGLLWYIRPFFRYMFRTDEHDPGNSPNEDIFMSMLVFGSAVFRTQTYVPTYSKVWSEMDNKPAFRFQKIVQQIIQWQERHRIGARNKRWLMKTPEHAGFMRDLMQVYPDAFVMLTHRNPVPVVSSFIPMVIYTAGFWNSKIDAIKFAEYQLDSLEHILNNLVDQVEVIPKNQIMHVPFSKFVNDNYAVIEEVCRFSGLSLSPEAVNRMQKYIETSPREGANRFEYKIETFGPAFKKEALQKRFKHYMDKFQEYV